MNLLVVGDVHGCFFTFRNLLRNYWNIEEEMLIQVGDLIDRGKQSPQVVDLARQLRDEFPNQAVFLKGNHEFEMISHFMQEPNHNWLKQGGEDTLRQYMFASRDPVGDVQWFNKLPLFWENDHVFISHAGISENTTTPFIESHPYSVLWNRAPLKNINKLQIIGHTPGHQPTYDERSNSWNIDTGAAYSRYLTGLKLTPNGEIQQIVKADTDSRDI